MPYYNIIFMILQEKNEKILKIIMKFLLKRAISSSYMV